MPLLTLEMGNYRNFIRTFRSWTGMYNGAVPGGDTHFDVRLAGLTAPTFTYRAANMYMEAVNDHQLQQVNYAHLGPPDILTGNSIDDALRSATHDAGRKLCMVIAFTSEAARSQVVYRAMQYLIQGSVWYNKITWNQLEPLFHNWDMGVAAHRPRAFGPLEAIDYAGNIYASRAAIAVNEKTGLR